MVQRISDVSASDRFGYAPDILTVDSWDDPPFVSVDAGYLREGKPLGITIMSYTDEPSMQVEKTDAMIEWREKNGTTFYLIENITDNTVAWVTDRYECYICASMDKDTLWKIAESMYS